MLEYSAAFIDRIIRIQSRLYHESVLRGGYSYLDNPQYAARSSMFDITRRDKAKIVFAGDSITGFGNFEEFFNETDIINRGIGSDTAEGLYNRMDQVIDLQPEIVFIMIGINDVGKDIPVMDTVGYLRSSCEKVVDACPECHIYVLSVLPTMTANRDQKIKIQQINEEYESCCENNSNLTFVNLYTLYLDEVGAPKPELYSKDGVHLNGNGYQIWIDELQDYIDNE